MGGWEPTCWWGADRGRVEGIYPYGEIKVESMDGRLGDEGEKLVIIDIVIGAGQSEKKRREMQVVFDLFIMFINGTERDENQWKKIFFEAGFHDYKITPVLGVRSIIEVYP